MSALCGIMCLDGRQVDFENLRTMGRAMRCRGIGNKGAYLDSRAGLMEISPGNGGDPYVTTVDGASYVVMLDGRVESICGDGDPEAGVSGRVERRMILDAYLALGANAVSYMEGDYALAIYDGGRGELLVAGSGWRHPIFYCETDGYLIFASELKGILPLLPSGLRVDSEVLRGQLLRGDRFCDELYIDVGELGGGSSLRSGELGVFVSEYPTVSFEGDTRVGQRKKERAVSYDIEELLRALVEVYDRPMFDCVIPRLLAGETEPCLPSGAGSRERRYILERADRIDLIRRGMPRLMEKRNGHSLKALEKKLDSLLAKYAGEGVVKSIIRPYEREIWDTLSREKDRGRRIRIKAMVCQLKWWGEAYDLRIE